MASYGIWWIESLRGVFLLHQTFCHLLVNVSIPGSFSNLPSFGISSWKLAQDGEMKTF
jgi:hypothetical protein